MAVTSVYAKYKAMKSEGRLQYIEDLDLNIDKNIDHLKKIMNPLIEGKMEIREFILDKLLFSGLKHEDMIKICCESLKDRGGKVRDKALTFLNNYDFSFDFFFENLEAYHFNNEIVEFIYQRQREIINYLLQTEVKPSVLFKILSITQEKERVRSLKILRSFYENKGHKNGVIDTLLSFEIPPFDLKLFIKDLHQNKNSSDVVYYLRKILPAVKNFLDEGETDYLIDLFLKRLKEMNSADILRYLLESMVEQGRIDEIIEMYNKFHYKKIPEFLISIGEIIKKYDVESLQAMLANIIPYLKNKNDSDRFLELIISMGKNNMILRDIYTNSGKSRHFTYYFSYDLSLEKRITDFDFSELERFVEEVFKSVYNEHDIPPHLLFKVLTLFLVDNSQIPAVNEYSRNLDFSSNGDKSSRSVIVDILGKYSVDFYIFKTFLLDPSDDVIVSAINNLSNYPEGLKYCLLYASSDKIVSGEYIIKDHRSLESVPKRFYDLAFEMLDCFRIENRKEIDCFLDEYGEEYLPGVVYLLASNGFLTEEEINIYKNSGTAVKSVLFRGLLASKNEVIINDLAEEYYSIFGSLQTYEQRYRILDILNKFQTEGIKKISEIMIHIHKTHSNTFLKQRLIAECFEFIKNSIWFDYTFEEVAASGILDDPIISSEYMKNISTETFAEKFMDIYGSNPVDFSNTLCFYNWAIALKGRKFSYVPENLKNFFSSLRMSSNNAAHREEFKSFLNDLGVD